jgi:hypothetical protein
MIRTLLAAPLLIAGMALAQDAPPPTASAPPAGQGRDGDAKTISGMSILGNQEAPKSLVIVPWKSSEIGDSLAVNSMLDDSRRPVDKDVFMRELGYYQIRSK